LAITGRPPATASACASSIRRGLLAGGHRAEAGVGDQRAAEAPAQALDELSARIPVQHAQVGEPEGPQAVQQTSVRGPQVGGIGLQGVLHVVLG